MRSPDPRLVHTDNFHARYEGTLTPARSGYYSVRLSGQSSATMFLNGQPFLTNHGEGGFHSTTAGIQLIQGVSYPVQIEYHAGLGDASLYLEWSLPQEPGALEAEVRQEAPMLRQADAVIFVGGWDHGQDNEGLDRQNMDFPRGQQELIRRVAAINPRLAVVLLHGSPFTVSGWIDSVPAVLDAWYPGMEGGTAVAEALVGDINPGGKLTFSWPKRLNDSPTYAIGTANKDDVDYREGVFVGYRYFDSRNVEPQFPFGFGLSYSSFAFTRLTAMRSGSHVHASVEVTNTSARAGTEIVQLYVSPPKTSVERPVHELRSFERIQLGPKQRRKVSFELGPESFRHWDVRRHAWQRDLGEYVLQVGESSRALPLQTHIRIDGVQARSKRFRATNRPNEGGN